MQRSNTFEGGTNAATITTGNSGGASGDAWSAVSIGASGALVYDNTHGRGNEAMKLVMPATAVDIYTSWDTLGSLTTDVWHRAYFYLPSWPSTLNFYPLAGWSSGLAQVYRMFINAGAGTISFRDGADSVITALNGTVAMTAGQLVRFEWRVKASATVGELEWWLYNSPESNTADETKAATGLALAANLDRADFGAPFGAGNEVSFTTWMDDIAISSVAKLGPSAQPHPFLNVTLR